MTLIFHYRLSALCALLLLISAQASVPPIHLNKRSLNVQSLSSGTESSAPTGLSVSSVPNVPSTSTNSVSIQSTTSHTSFTASVTTTTETDTSTSGALPPTVTAIITLPISSYPFSAFPVPTASTIPGVFPSTSPSSPPPPGSRLIPDFGPAWAAAKTKAKTLLSGWTFEQKVNVTAGVGSVGNRCVGNIAPIGDDWPGLCFEDGPLGVRLTDFNTAFPAGMNAAATWNRTLIRARGKAIGQEMKGKGVNVGLGPMMNIGRVPQGGRNWEGFGSDPFLSGEVAYETVLGWQEGGAQACAKHFINNEQESLRLQESSHVDDRTEHEIYVHPFMRAVQAGVASVMCSYNLVNDTYACENDRTLNQILKGEIGFQGYVVTDWVAQRSTLAAVAGLDLSMPGDISPNSGTSWFGANLTAFVENGTIAEARVDDMAERIIAAWYFLGQDDNYPEVNFNIVTPDDPATNQHVDVQEDHFKIVREVGAASVVLLKNVADALPLKKPRSLAIIGNDSAPSLRGPNGYPSHASDDGTLAMGWGSGTVNFPYLISPLEAIQARAREDRSSVSWFLSNWDVAGAATTALGQDVALVFANADSGEGSLIIGGGSLEFEGVTIVDGMAGDRTNLTLWGNAENLINAVAAVNPNTVVVVHSVGPVIVESWIDNPNVTAVLWAGLPGQESGNSLVDVLYGAANPSGRLPYTIAKDPADYPTQLVTAPEDTPPPADGGIPFFIIDYTEGLNIDYRHFDAQDIEPRFPFGFGLSYTTFEYSGLSVQAVQQDDVDSAALEAAWASGEASPNVEGGSTAIWLHRPAFEVSFNVSNTGKVKGGEIPQLYLHFPSSAGEPPSVLRGFSDVLLEPGENEAVTITLSRYDLSVWDVVAQGWRKPEGEFTFSVGASSRDFRLNGTIPL